MTGLSQISGVRPALLLLIATASYPMTTTAQDTRTLSDNISILDTLDGYIFEARRAESTATRTAGYLKAAMKRLDHASTELENSRMEFRQAGKNLEKTLRIARLAGGGGGFEAVFLPDKTLDGARRASLLKRLAKRQADELARLIDSHQKAVTMEFVAGMERAQAWVLARVSEDALKKLEHETAARKHLLKLVNRDLRMFKRRAAELSLAQRVMIKTIESRLSSRQGPVNFDDRKGLMPMPLVDGTVEVPFGDAVHPRFKTVTPHPGWTMSFKSRGPRNVRSIAFGRVVWTGRMRGFGNTVVVDHASGWYSVYGGLTTLKVDENAVVRQGNVIAQVEAPPGDSSVTMYFELRRGSVAIDPAEYIITTPEQVGSAQ